MAYAVHPDGSAQSLKSNIGADRPPDNGIDTDAAGYGTGSLWLVAGPPSRLWVYLLLAPGVGAWFELKDGGITTIDQLNALLSTGPWFGDGVLVRDSGNYILRRDASEVTDPGVNDDSSSGFSVHSQWINTSTNAVWVCTSAAVGAAVWRRLDLP